MKTTFVIAGVVAALMGTAALAQGMGQGNGMGMGDGMGMGPGGMMGGMMPDFATLDANADGQITMDELTARSDARFATADADASGGLSVAEMVAMAEAIRLEAMTARMTAHVADIDANGDGQVQADEMGAGMPQHDMMFDMFDADNSDGVSAEEFDAALAQMAEHRDGMRGDGRGEGRRGDHHGWGFWNRSGN